jgi:hypothetical protein
MSGMFQAVENFAKLYNTLPLVVTPAFYAFVISITTARRAHAWHTVSTGSSACALSWCMCMYAIIY